MHYKDLSLQKILVVFPIHFNPKEKNPSCMYRTSIKLVQLQNWIFNCVNNVSFGIIHVLHCTIVLNFMQVSSTKQWLSLNLLIQKKIK